MRESIPRGVDVCQGSDKVEKRTLDPLSSEKIHAWFYMGEFKIFSC